MKKRQHRNTDTGKKRKQEDYQGLLCTCTLEKNSPPFLCTSVLFLVEQNYKMLLLNIFLIL